MSHLCLEATWRQLLGSDGGTCFISYTLYSIDLYNFVHLSYFEELEAENHAEGRPRREGGGRRRGGRLQQRARLLEAEVRTDAHPRRCPRLLRHLLSTRVPGEYEGP